MSAKLVAIGKDDKNERKRTRWNETYVKITKNLHREKRRLFLDLLEVNFKLPNGARKVLPISCNRASQQPHARMTVIFGSVNENRGTFRALIFIHRNETRKDDSRGENEIPRMHVHIRTSLSMNEFTIAMKKNARRI